MPSVPDVDGAENRLEFEVIGNKSDAAVKIVSVTASIVAYLKGLLGVLAPDIATGEADIDVSEADYTAFQVLVTIVPATGAPLADAEIVFDLAKASTGFGPGHTTETIQFAVARKVDGTNWRTDAEQVTTAITGTNAALASVHLPIGSVGVTEQVRVMVILSAENAVDVEIPFALAYNAAAAPTVTPVAAA